jgi:hypothetical protein
MASSSWAVPVAGLLTAVGVASIARTGSAAATPADADAVGAQSSFTGNGSWYAPFSIGNDCPAPALRSGNDCTVRFPDAKGHIQAGDGGTVPYYLCPEDFPVLLEWAPPKGNRWAHIPRGVEAWRNHSFIYVTTWHPSRYMINGKTYSAGIDGRDSRWDNHIYDEGAFRFDLHCTKDLHRASVG